MANRTIARSYADYIKEQESIYRDWRDVPVLLTIEQTARLLQCSAPTVRKLISTGELAAISSSQLVRIDKRAVEGLISTRGS